ncbi:MAG: recombinase family protein [Sporanaerobacter sp.]|uniref:recombinase family protein n=1 Tax=Sporanaerobacter sp. TaxID=2010183 RepID=UPI003A0FD5A1
MQRNYAYLRVSTKEQNLDRQLDAIRQLDEHIDERDIYTDKQSGKDFNRPEWQALKRSIRTGDTLFIHSLDRLGVIRLKFYRNGNGL